MAKKINDYLSNFFPSEILNSARQQAMQQAIMGTPNWASRSEMLNQQMEHIPYQSPYQKFQQSYPRLDQYVRDVVTGRVAYRGLNELANNLNKAYTDPSALENYLGFGGITAFHGSPHKFKKFMMDKIGTGEGAQAYGHGLYFAESPGVAKSYQMTFDSKYENANQDLKKWAVSFDDFRIGQKVENMLSKERNIEKRMEYLKSIENNNLLTAGDKKIINKMNKTIKHGKFDEGVLYEVDIPDSAIDNMLDWDKPLNEQSENVKSIFTDESGSFGQYSGLTGSQAYKKLSIDVGGSKAASEQMNSLGIPGIKYFDAVSREAKEGTRNYVVFDENIVNIMDIK